MYNFLNLPQTITKSGSSLTYYYSATGEKACKQVGAVKRYYAGGFEYDNSKNLVLIHHPEGVVEKSGSTFTYEYFLKDHLGNTRIAFRPNGANKTLTQRLVYYPFGHTAEQENSNSNQYKYNGKELQEDIGLNWYDYEARFYEPIIARFHSQDPLAEDYKFQTTYAYAANSPIKFIDKQGMKPDDYIINDEGVIVDIKKNNKPPKLIMRNHSGEDKELNFNDPPNDQAQLRTFKKGEKILNFISDDHIDGFMKDSKVERKNFFKRNWKSLTESNAGDLDFGLEKLGFNPTQDMTGGFVLFGDKDKVYNLGDGGNFLWGYAASKLGHGLGWSKFWADANEWFGDTKEDQQAIKDGHNYETERNKRKRKDEEEID